MREALTRGNWDGVGAAIADEWQNRKRLAPGVTTPGIEQLIGRATGRRHRRQGLRGRRRRLPLHLRPPERRTEIAGALAAGGARILDYRFEQHGLVRG
jgi:galactokinase/mevalonate kinase-like predicted kinase